LFVIALILEVRMWMKKWVSYTYLLHFQGFHYYL
jgi:hypothetical protein